MTTKHNKPRKEKGYQNDDKEGLPMYDKHRSGMAVAVLYRLSMNLYRAVRVNICTGSK